MLQVVSDLLQSAGYSVHTLASPIGATQVIATRGIAAAIIDLNMPVMRGDRFITLVRSWDRIRDLPIVLLSGESKSTLQEAVQHLPGVAVVTKERMSDQLVPTLRQAMNGRIELELGGRRASAPGASPARFKLDAVQAAGQRPVIKPARAALLAWQSFVAAPASGAQQAYTAFSTLQRELKGSGQPVGGELLALAQHVLETCAALRQVSSEAEAIVNELLSLLVNGAEKQQGLENSLAVSLLRTRLERLRQAQR